MIPPRKSKRFSEGTRLGRYVLRQPIGEGGNGQVFVGWQENATGRPLPCIVKLPLQRQAVSPKGCQHLLDEASLAIRLGSHPNIVQVIDADVHDGLPFIVMEYVKGADLGQLLRLCREQGRPMPLPCVFEILASAAEGLHYAHVKATENGQPIEVVHRDIKPGNILITRDGGTKLGDFGLGRTMAEGTTGEYLRGTYRYMSPEHIASQVRPEMDIYSLGVVAWEMVENRIYREGVNGTAHFSLIMDGDVPPMTNPAVPEALREIIRACLEPSRRVRPDAGELGKLLRRCPGYERGPDAVCQMTAVLLGDYRPSGTTGAVAAATPELAATLAAVTALKGAQPDAARGATARKHIVAREERTAPHPVRPTVSDADAKTLEVPKTAVKVPTTVTLATPPCVGSGGESQWPGEAHPAASRPVAATAVAGATATQRFAHANHTHRTSTIPSPRKPRPRGRWTLARLLLVMFAVISTVGAGLWMHRRSAQTLTAAVANPTSVPGDREHPAVGSPPTESPQDSPRVAVGAAVERPKMPSHGLDDFACDPVFCGGVPSSDDRDDTPQEPITASTESPPTAATAPPATPRKPKAKAKAKTKRRAVPKAPEKPGTPARLIVDEQRPGTIFVKVGRRTIKVSGEARMFVGIGSKTVQWNEPEGGWRSLGAKSFQAGERYLLEIDGAGKPSFRMLSETERR